MRRPSLRWLTTEPALGAAPRHHHLRHRLLLHQQLRHRPDLRLRAAARLGDSVLRHGDLVAGYRIESQRGRGGMATVYEATQLSLERRVALKLLDPGLSEDDVFRERFRREGRLQANLHHPHIVSVFEAGESPAGLFIAMRLVDGPTLKSLVGTEQLTPDRSVSVIQQIADALDCAHAAGLVHRDVKPQNILVDQRGPSPHAFLADFGVTRTGATRVLTRAGQTLGTLDYISPEQIRGEPATVQSDVYSLAAVAFECLTGTVPFPADTDAAVLYAHLHHDLPSVASVNPSLPTSLDPVLLVALAKVATDRYESASRFSDALTRALTATDTQTSFRTPSKASREEARGMTIHDPVGGVAQRPPELPHVTSVSRPLLAILAGLVVVATAVGLLLGKEAHNSSPLSSQSTLGTSFEVKPVSAWRPVPSPDPRLRPLLPKKAVYFAGASEAAAGIASTETRTTLSEAFPTLEHPAGTPLLINQRFVMRYRVRLPRTGKRASLFLIPMTRRTLIVACVAASPTADCAQLVAAAQARPRDAGVGRPAPSYAATVASSLATVHAAEAAVPKALRSGGFDRGRVAAARAHTDILAAAVSLSDVSVPDGPLGANRILFGSLRNLADAYEALATALTAHDQRRYVAATRSIVAQRGRIQSALGALEALGYRLDGGQR